MAAFRERALAWLYTRPQARAWALLAPGGFWLLAFFLVPLLIMLVYSLMPRGIYGGVEPGFTLEHYARFFAGRNYAFHKIFEVGPHLLYAQGVNRKRDE